MRASIRGGLGSGATYLIGADSPTFTQEEPFSQSCQEEYLSYLPLGDDGERPESKSCRGYTEESYKEYMESFAPDEPRDLEDYMEDGTMQCNLFDPEKRKEEAKEQIEEDNEESLQEMIENYQDYYEEENP